MKWVVIRAEPGTDEWTGGSVVEAKNKKDAVTQAAGEHPGEYHAMRVPKDPKTFTVSRSVTIK